MSALRRILPVAALAVVAACSDQMPSTPSGPPGPSLDIGFDAGGFATAHNGTGSNSRFLTIQAPPVDAGDVLLAQIGLTKDINPGDKICAPEGWVSLVKNNFENKYVQEIFYHVAPANAGATNHTWRFKTSAGNCAVAGNANARTGKGASGGILRFAGVDPEDPIDAFASLSGGSSPPYRAPSVTTSSDGARVVRFFTGEKHPMTFGPAATRVYNVGTKNNSVERTVAAFQAGQTSAGPTGVFDAMVNTSAEWVSATVALRPDGCVTEPCTQEVIDLAVGGSVVLSTGDRIDIPAQDNLTGEITLTLQYCDGIDLDVPLFNPCLRVDAPDLPPLSPLATVSVCTVLPGLTEDQEKLVTIYRQEDDGDIFGLPHANDLCVPVISGNEPADRPLMGRVLVALRDAVARLVAPRPLVAASPVRVMLDAGLGGLTGAFSEFQPGLPVQISPVEGTAEQDGIVNSPVANPPAVVVTDANGDAAAGAMVHFEVTMGGGSITGAAGGACTPLAAGQVCRLSVITGEDGVATAELASWVLGSAAGENRVRAYGRGIAGPDDDGVFAPPVPSPAGQLPVLAETGEAIFTADGAEVVIDGVISAGEWDDADTFGPFTVDLSDEGTTTATLLVKNTGTTLYMALVFDQSLSGESNVILAVRMDEDADGDWDLGDGAGEDGFVVQQRIGGSKTDAFFDEFFTCAVSPCQGQRDDAHGGTNDGTTASTDGLATVIEVAKGINTADPRDATLAVEDVLRFFLFTNIGDTGDLIRSDFPTTGWALYTVR